MRLLTIVALLVGTVAAQDLGKRFVAQEEAAFRHFERQEWDKAIAGFQAQIALYADNPRPYYNIACVYARRGDPVGTGAWLSEAIDRGWRDLGWLVEDPDLEKVRASAEYKAAEAKLRAARAKDPDPVPRDLAPDSVPAAPTAMRILRDTAAQLGLLLPQETLRGEHDFQKRLFAVYDVRRARLTRYLRDHGDARDADLAAMERIRTSLRYAAADARVTNVARKQALAEAEMFLRRYPTSPLLTDVRLLRAQATDDDPALLESLLRDDPVHDRARTVLCIRYTRPPVNHAALRRHFAMLEPRTALDGRLMAVRLFAKGLPQLDETPPSDRAHLYHFISLDDAKAPARIAALRAIKSVHVVVVCVGPTTLDPDAWLAKHAVGCRSIARGTGLARLLRLRATPTTILAKPDGTVLAVDPTDEEIKRAAAR